MRTCLSKRSKLRRHPSTIRGIFLLVICSFRVYSCDKKNLKFHSIRCIMKLVVCFISPRQRLGDIKHTTRFIIEARGYKTHNSFHNTSYGMKIHLRSYIYRIISLQHNVIPLWYEFKISYLLEYWLDRSEI